MSTVNRCSQCGAPLESGAVSCRYCDSNFEAAVPVQPPVVQIDSRAIFSASNFFYAIVAV